MWSQIPAKSSGKSLHPTQIGLHASKHGPFLAVRTMNPSVNFPKPEVERVGSITCSAAPLKTEEVEYANLSTKAESTSKAAIFQPCSV
jgi:hypothetical protein